MKLKLIVRTIFYNLQLKSNFDTVMKIQTVSNFEISLMRQGETKETLAHKLKL